MRYRVFGLAVMLSSQALAESVAVEVGGDPNVDACMAMGMTNQVAEVRVGPSSQAEVAARLGESQMVWLCAEQSGAYGVVYASGNEDCGVSHPITKRGVYTGPCQSGWVSKTAIDLLAG